MYKRLAAMACGLVMIMGTAAVGAPDDAAARAGVQLKMSVASQTGAPGKRLDRRVGRQDPGHAADVKQGKSVTFTITAHNATGDAKDDVTIIDDIGDLLGDFDLDMSKGIVLKGEPADPDKLVYDPDAKTLSWKGHLDKDQDKSFPFSLIAHTDAKPEDQRTNTVKGSGTNCDAQPEDVCTSTVTVKENTEQNDVQIKKTSDPVTGSSILPGTTVDYTLQAAVPAGKTAQPGYTVTDDATALKDYIDDPSKTLPDSVTYANGVFTWNAGDLEPGAKAASVTFPVTFKDDPAAIPDGTRVTNKASGPDSNCVAGKETPQCESTLVLSSPAEGFVVAKKTADKITVEPGQKVNYAVTFTLKTKDQSETVTVKDDLTKLLPYIQEQGAALKKILTEAGFKDFDGKIATWSGDTLTKDQTVTIKYAVTPNDEVANKALHNEITTDTGTDKLQSTCSTGKQDTPSCYVDIPGSAPGVYLEKTVEADEP